jgi:hypothetical protein
MAVMVAVGRKGRREIYRELGEQKGFNKREGETAQRERCNMAGTEDFGEGGADSRTNSSNKSERRARTTRRTGEDGHVYHSRQATHTSGSDRDRGKTAEKAFAPRRLYDNGVRVCVCMFSIWSAVCIDVSAAAIPSVPV